MKTLKELQEQLKTSLTEARDLCDLVDKENRDFTEEERTKVSDLLEAARNTKTEIHKLQNDEAMRKQILDLGADLNNGGTPGDGSRSRTGAMIQSLGQRFIEDAAWKAWLKDVAPSGLIPESRKGLSSPSVQVKSFGIFPCRKDLITGVADDSAGSFIIPEDTGIYEPIGRYPLVLRQLINVRTTGSDQVEFVRQVTQVRQAAPVAESNVTDYTGATGQVSGQKPEGAMMFERVTENVKTVAVWIPATKRALSDAAQLRGLIDQELRDDLADEFEDQLLNGDGVGENFTGLENTAGTLVQVWNTNAIITARQAITTLLITGRQIPTAFLFHPSDWEGIDLLRDTTGRFIRGDPFGAGPNTLWGVPVVQSFHLTEGSAWLANWRKMVVWDREQATISVSDSHADFFIRNMVAILAEMRAAMGIIRPSAFVEIDLTGGS